jgi:predicted permease
LPEVFQEPISPGYFETIGARLLQGRTFTIDDNADHPLVIVINESMAKRFWPNESPLGKRVGQQGQDHQWQEVVGVVNDIGFPANLGDPYTRLQMFRPIEQAPWGGGWSIEVRGSTSREAFANDLRSAVSGMDPDMPVSDIRSARSLVEQGLGSISLLGTLLGAFAALGLTLAAIGIYGVTSYSVAQRTGEIGIRMALGAQRNDVLKLVLSQGVRLMSAGVLIGLAGAYAVSRLLVAAIPILPTGDPLTVVAVTVVLTVIALIACYIPAQRATRVDPMVALKD